MHEHFLTIMLLLHDRTAAIIHPCDGNRADSLPLLGVAELQA